MEREKEMNYNKIIKLYLTSALYNKIIYHLTLTVLNYFLFKIAEFSHFPFRGGDRVWTDSLFWR